jgi:hypothetical protein
MIAPANIYKHILAEREINKAHASAKVTRAILFVFLILIKIIKAKCIE